MRPGTAKSRGPLIPAPLAILACALIAAPALDGTARAALIQGTSGADRLVGTSRADMLYGRAGRDRLEGRGGSDFLDAGNGGDVLQGSTGNDRFVALADGAVDAVHCGPGRDIVNIELRDRIGSDCEVVSRQLSRDPFRNRNAQHETQVEPDSFAHGSTIVAVFQSGRFESGGATSIGFATSRDAGRSWFSGFLPGLSIFSAPAGQFVSVSDPVVGYDAAHGVWLAASLGGSFGVTDIVVSRSQRGRVWTLPVTVAHGSAEDFDKEWLVCDNWRGSPFRGRCYVSYMNHDLIETRSSSDGGLTWSAPASVSVRRAAVVNGVQPVVRPDGSLVIVFAVFGSTLPGGNEIAAIRSTDGGTSFSTVSRVASLSTTEVTGMRAPPFPSVEVDGAGTIYAAWSDCRFSEQCIADIVLARSSDGVTWTAPERLPVGETESGIPRFLPGLAVDPATSGSRARIALLFHSQVQPLQCDPVSFCLGVDAGLVTSRNGGATWGRPQRLNARSMPLYWIANTDIGHMLGDYVSASWVSGRPVPVFAVASAPSSGLFRQAIFATTRIKP